MMTPKDDYLVVIKNNQLIALDLIIIDENDRVLLGYRNNNPAKHYWFTFGSRVFKNETFEEACERVSNNELGVNIKLKDCTKRGVYFHKYDNNFDNNDFGTTYVVFGFVYKCNSKDMNINGDSQHSLFNWLSLDEIMKRDDVHQYVKNYFIEEAENRCF